MIELCLFHRRIWRMNSRSESFRLLVRGLTRLVERIEMGDELAGGNLKRDVRKRPMRPVERHTHTVGMNNGISRQFSLCGRVSCRHENAALQNL